MVRRGNGGFLCPRPHPRRRAGRGVLPDPNVRQRQGERRGSRVDLDGSRRLQEHLMYRKILLGGVTAAAILGAGGTAVALTGSDTATRGIGKAASAPATGPNRPGHATGRGRLFKHLSHGQLVTHGKKGFVTHEFINGTVTAVSSTSITVQPA